MHGCGSERLLTSDSDIYYTVWKLHVMQNTCGFNLVIDELACLYELQNALP